MKKIIKILVVLMIVLAGTTGCQSEEEKEALKAFDTEVERIEEQIEDFEKEIEACEELTTTEDTALNEELRVELETAISNAKVAVEVEIPEAKNKVVDINKQTEELKQIDLTADKQLLLDSKAAFEKSIKQYKLVDHPTEAYVIERLTGLENISEISAVTEDNDPNGMLNKPGGYTATVYYRDARLNLDPEIYGYTVIEQATDGGGAVEVYETVEQAEKRRDYLSTFDGTRTASGTHTVVGTCLVRTSNELMASQQKEMEAKIIESLTYVE